MMPLEYWQEVIKATQAPWGQEAENHFNNLEWEQYFKHQEVMSRKFGFPEAYEKNKRIFAELEDLEIVNGMRPIPFQRRHEFNRHIK